jgi:hypothetical protein
MVVTKQHNYCDFPTLVLVTRHQAFKVSTLVDAANALLSHWVDDDGEEYIVAVKTCLDAIYGIVSPDDARIALMRAADEAGIRVIALVSGSRGILTGTRTAA